MTPIEKVARAIVRERCAQMGEPMPEGPLTEGEVGEARAAIRALADNVSLPMQLACCQTIQIGDFGHSAFNGEEAIRAAILAALDEG